MKESVIKILHFILGYERYLRIFTVLKIRTLALDRRKSDFIFFTKILNKNATVVVIGACTGITTIPFVKKYPERKVFAYEPLSSNYAALHRIIRWYKLNNVAYYHLGLSNITEKREIVLPVLKGVKKQGMAHIVDNSIQQYNEGIMESTTLDLLDNRSEISSIKVDAIKIVAENFELEIFEGARKIIEKNKPVIYCELWNNPKRTAVLELIRAYNYTIYFRKGKNLIAYENNNYHGKNFFFKPVINE